MAKSPRRKTGWKSFRFDPKPGGNLYRIAVRLNLAASLHQVTPSQAILRAGGIECAGDVALGEQNQPSAQVAHVDDLDRIGGGAGNEHFAASIHADGPVGEAAAWIVRAHDVAGANYGDCR